MASNPAPGFTKHSGYNIELQLADPVIVSKGGQIIAKSSTVLSMLEGSYSPVWYIPFEDIAANFISKSETTSYCPFKGTASYWNIVVDGETIVDAAWSYEVPFDEMQAIKGHLAFYPDKVVIEQV
jgi:uncharacterized protein (DUF427 family)